MFDPLQKIRIADGKRIAYEKRGVVGFLLFLCGIFVLCGILIAFSYLFFIRSVTFAGNGYYTEEELLSASEIRVGAPLSSVECVTVTEKLLQLSHIKTAEAQKDVFGHVTVNVTEHSVAYGVQAENGCFLVSEDLYVIEMVDGLDAAYMQLVLPTGVSVEAGAFASVSYGETETAKILYDTLCADSAWGGVYRLDLSTPYSAKFVLSDGITVRLGNADDRLSEKLQLVKSVMAQNPNDGTWTRAEIDVSSGDRATFRVLH